MTRKGAKAGGRPGPDVETGVEEWEGSMRNGRGSGKMKSNKAEVALGGQHTGAILTLGHESVGMEQD